MTQLLDRDGVYAIEKKEGCLSLYFGIETPEYIAEKTVRLAKLAKKRINFMHGGLSFEVNPSTRFEEVYQLIKRN